MKRSTFAAAVMLAASLAAVAPSFLYAQTASAKTAAGSYKIDAVHSSVLFNITHANVATSWGRVNDPAGTITVADDGTVSVEITLQLEKIDTANAARDKHLKGPDFFNAAQFPTMTFKGSGKPAAEGGDVSISGDLTIKGTSKPITVTLKKIGEADGGARLGYRLGYDTTFTINRFDYGIDYGKGMLGDNANLIVSLEGVKE